MNNYYILKYDDGEQVTKRTECEDKWSFFQKIAVTLAMSDCTGEEVVKIVWDGEEYHYSGWEPNMEYRFVKEGDPSETYTVWIPEYNH